MTREGITNRIYSASDLGVGTDPLLTSNDRERLATGDAVEVGDANVVAFSPHSVPFFAPTEVVTGLAVVGDVVRAVNYRK